MIGKCAWFCSLFCLGFVGVLCYILRIVCIYSKILLCLTTLNSYIELIDLGYLFGCIAFVPLTSIYCL